MPVLSIVVPAYNERATLRTVLARLLALDLRPLGLTKEILVVDDGSTDGTREIIDRLNTHAREDLAAAVSRIGEDLDGAFQGVAIRGLLHPKNRGKSAALRTGFDASTGDYVIIQDADLEYVPADIPRVLQPLLDGHADVVYGSRFSASERRALMYWHTLGNKAITHMVNMVADLNLTDVETCYKAFRGDIIRSLALDSERFGFEVEVTLKVSRLKYRIYEVPVRYHGRTYALGKKIGWKDGVEAIWCTARYATATRVVRGPVMEQTLAQLQDVTPLNRAMYEAIRPWLGQVVAEVGAGNGNITEYLLSGRDVVATDVDPVFLARLRNAFGDYDNVRIGAWDLEKPYDGSEADRIDTVVALNVVEHVQDDVAAIRNMGALVRPRGGRVVLLVPGHPRLFSELDRDLGHHRRYTAASLRETVERAGLTVEHEQWFNLLGLPGWWFNANVTGNTSIDPKMLAIYRRLAGAILPMEGRSRLPIGLSRILVAR